MHWIFEQPKHRRSLHRPCSASSVSIRVGGYAGPGWDLECTGPRRWAEAAINRWAVRVRNAALRTPNEKLRGGGQR